MAEFETIAMIGCGSMGGGMALLFAENGVNVALQDPSVEAMDGVIEKAEKAGYHGRVKKFDDYPTLISSLSTPHLTILSLPHGPVGDTVLSKLLPLLPRSSIILDCGNEHFATTQRRQQQCSSTGIRYIGCGVSGGYQAARAGPSMCPGGDASAIEEVLPLLRRVAAKDKNGEPCVGYVGKGGSGHFVKMMHNGIEHGMMSGIAEGWGVMRRMGMGFEEIGEVLGRWDAEGELKGTFLISIGADLSHKRDTSSTSTSTSTSTSEKNPLVLPQVLDKVVQDITGEEGTGIWSNTQSITLHIPAPTLHTAHAFRLASAYRGARESAHALFAGGFPAQPLPLDGGDKPAFLEDLRKAVYLTCLASFAQGLAAIAAADREHEWAIDYAAVWQIWRAGCIIQADYISDEILEPILRAPGASHGAIDLLASERVARDVRNCIPSLRRVVAKAVETDQVIPAMSASLEYWKIVTGTELPTAFYEAELDYFGAHMFDKVGDGDEGVREPREGKHHFEWKPARSQKEVYGKVGEL